jgi:hypothetical protein
MIDITEKLRQPAEKREPLNKFRVSECWACVNGYKSLKEFVEGKETEPSSTYIMDSGTARHEMIQRYLKDEYEMEIPVKKEIGEIIISGRADMVRENEVWEIKTSFNLIDSCKSWYEYQVKMYLSLLEKERGFIVQPIIQNKNDPKNFKVLLNVLGEVKRDDTWFSEQIKLLTNFYHRVEKKYGKNNISK